MIQYKVRPVTRFVVTRYSDDLDPDGKSSSSSVPKGEFDNFQTAHAVGYALAKEEQGRRGLDLGDMDLIFPEDVIYQDAKRFDILCGESNITTPDLTLPSPAFTGMKI